MWSGRHITHLTMFLWLFRFPLILPSKPFPTPRTWSMIKQTAPEFRQLSASVYVCKILTLTCASLHLNEEFDVSNSRFWQIHLMECR